LVLKIGINLNLSQMHGAQYITPTSR